MLETIGEGIWGYTTDLKMGPGMRLPTRTTIMRAGSGDLVVHAPLRIDDDTWKEIDALGDVRYLVAPNCYHWLFLAKAAQRYPKAKVLGPAGLEKKLTDTKFDALPADGVLTGLGEDVQIELVAGAPAMNEHVFLHAPSRSLVVTDLLFNVHSCSSFGMKAFLWLGGAWQKTSQSVIWRFLVKDRPAAGRSASKILDWDFERVVVGHGDIVADDARERARQALAWMAKAAPVLDSAVA